MEEVGKKAKEFRRGHRWRLEIGRGTKNKSHEDTTHAEVASSLRLARKPRVALVRVAQWIECWPEN